MDEEIHSLLRQIEGNEELKVSAYEYMYDYRGYALARPKQDHVDLLRALLKTKLKELIASARRDGLL